MRTNNILGESKRGTRAKAFVALAAVALLAVSSVPFFLSGNEDNEIFTVGSASPASVIDAGKGHSLALMDGGTVWAWGENGYGQLGDGTTDNSNTPVQAMVSPGVPLDGAVAASAGALHSIVLKDDGTVWAWGHNNWGQLGDGTTDESVTPVQVIVSPGVPLDGVAAVSAGAFYNIVLKDDGTVWAWGHNIFGQFGNGSNVGSLMPVQAMASPGVPLDGVAAISAGDFHSIVLKDDGTVWAWGQNVYGQLGDGTVALRRAPVQVMISSGAPLDGVAAVSAGMYHNIVLKDDGTVWAWGHNNWGQLGDGTTDNSSTALQVTVSPGAPLDGVAAVSAGGNHTIAMKDDGTVWAWGWNVYGQLGDGTTNDSSTPVQAMASPGVPLDGVAAVSAGDYHILVMKDDGTAWAWGANYNGLLGDGATDNSSTPVQVRLKYAVTIRGNVSTDAPAIVNHSGHPSFAIAMDDGYRFDSITATMGDVALTEGATDDYTYTDGIFTMLVGVIGNLVITMDTVKVWNVTFIQGNGGPQEDMLVDDGDRIVAPAEPTRNGHRFGGWFNGDTEWDFVADTVSSDVVLTAEWTKARGGVVSACLVLAFSVLFVLISAGMHSAKRKD
ncbi:MAG: InlB B-repeat-containing protein [Methanomassiliicoccaceae archaeon]|nr:InlB B-repeat-containing protein [Methanomassiliicoccaceae archaeon]